MKQQSSTGSVKWSYWTIIAIGLLLPWLTMVGVEWILGRHPFLEAVSLANKNALALGPFYLWQFLPFATLLGLVTLRHYYLDRRMAILTAMTGLPVISAFAIWGYISILGPMAKHERVSSTSAIAFVFIPIYASAILVLVFCIQYVTQKVSAWLASKKGILRETGIMKKGGWRFSPPGVLFC